MTSDQKYNLTLSCNISTNTDCLQNVTEIIKGTPNYLERSFGFLIIGIIGIVANFLVICILGSSVKIRSKVVNTLIIHQSFIDLLSSVALVATAHIDGTDKHGLTGIHADIYCYFIGPKLPVWSLMLISSFGLMFLNIERYISIVHPLYHHANVTRKKIVTLLPLVWILGILEHSLIASVFSSVDGACAVSIMAMFWVTIIGFIVLHFFLPLLLVFFLYGTMFYKLRNSTRRSEDHVTPDVASERRESVMERAINNIFKTMLIITICYGICFSFNCIYIALYLVGYFTTLSGKYKPDL